MSYRYADGSVLNLHEVGETPLWNTIYIEAALKQLGEEGYPVMNEDVLRLSPLLHEHINMLGRYSFSMPEAVAKGELSPSVIQQIPTHKILNPVFRSTAPQTPISVRREAPPD